METATTRINGTLRRYLHEQIDRAVRARTAIPDRYACRGCGADTRLLASPVAGCATCANRLSRRRSRAAASSGLPPI